MLCYITQHHIMLHSIVLYYITLYNIRCFLSWRRPQLARDCLVGPLEDFLNKVASNTSYYINGSNRQSMNSSNSSCSINSRNSSYSINSSNSSYSINSNRSYSINGNSSYLSTVMRAESTWAQRKGFSSALLAKVRVITYSIAKVTPQLYS